MEVLNKEEIYYKRAFNEKIIYGIKNKKINSEILNDDFTKNKKIIFQKLI